MIGVIMFSCQGDGKMYIGPVTVGTVLYKKVIPKGWRRPYTVVGMVVIHPGFENETINEDDNILRKCRVRGVEVLSGEGVSHWDNTTKYFPGEQVVVSEFEFDFRPDIICSSGIHGFRTFEEAETYDFR